jgi:hypothetical protein
MQFCWHKNNVSKHKRSVRMRRTLFAGAAMVVALMLAFALVGTQGAAAEAYDSELAQRATVTATAPGSLPDTGSEGGANIALLAVLGAVAIGVAGVALLSSGRKAEA